MGQKVNPVAFRLGVIKKWSSPWASVRGYAKRLHNDLNIRDYITEELTGMSVGKVEIDQKENNAEVTIYTSKPAVLIGRKGEKIDQIKDELSKVSAVPVKVNVKEIRKPDLNARIVAESISEQLKKRVSFKKILSFSSSRVMDAGAIGVKIQLSGRLGGTDMKRKEYVILGRVPLQTINSDIDYAYYPSRTQTGIVGVKVWIYKGNKRKVANTNNA